MGRQRVPMLLRATTRGALVHNGPAYKGFQWVAHLATQTRASGLFGHHRNLQFMLWFNTELQRRVGSVVFMCG